MTPFTEDMTLAEARPLLHEHTTKGIDCPVCEQFAKVYKRQINSTQAAALVVIHREVGRDWAHLPTLRMHLAPNHSNEEPKLRHWGLLEPWDGRRQDGGRSGLWRLTDEGEAFVLGRLLVPRFAHVFDGRCLGLSGDPVSIKDALGSKFDYRELMA